VRLWLTALAGGIGAHLATQAGAIATNATSASSPTGDPANALWSLLGSSTVAGVLYLWIRSEQSDRQQERTERLAATASKDQFVTKLVELIQADTENKAQIRERLKGQDDALTRLLEQQRILERAITDRNDRRPPRRGEAGG
jgi:hypothetical protein